MFTTTTPQRHVRGVPIGIDTTKSSFERPASALEYGGYYTPPQSAYESSRRPSLAALSHLDVPFSAASTATSFSLPPTPVHAEHMHSMHPHIPQVYDERSTSDLLPALNGSCGSCDQSSSALDQLFGGTNHGKDDNAFIWSAQAAHINVQSEHHSMSSFDQSQLGFQDSRMLPASFNGTGSGMGDTMLSDSIDMLAQRADAGDSWVSLPELTNSNIMQFGEEHPGHYQQQRSASVVALADLSPQDDYTSQQYSTLSSPGYVPALSADFPSSAASSFASVYEPPSPAMDYYDDVEDYGVVKHEPMMSPARVSRDRFGSDHRADRTRNRRTVKRKGKTPFVLKRKCYGIDFVVEGNNISIGPDGLETKVMTQEEDLLRKPHRCTFKMPGNVVCNDGFERSEHLKRHALQHADKSEHIYRCPVIDEVKPCTFSSGRSDNTRDHFKTHLLPKQTGRRNSLVTWQYLRDRIQEEYDEPASKKILDKLREWLEKPCKDPKKAKDHEALQREHGFGQWSSYDSTSRGRSRL